MSIEGIGGLKWSIAPEESPTAAPVYHVMQGVTKIASVLDLKLAKLICGAPQLWAASNEVLKLRDASPNAMYAKVDLLGEQVARAVGKAAWKDVAQ